MWLKASDEQQWEHNCPGVNYRLEALHDYRKIEICAFYSSLIGIMLYLIICKIFVALKKATCSPSEINAICQGESGPFWRLIMTNEQSLSDFIEKENYVMFSLSLMFGNFTFMMCCATLIFDSTTDIKAFNLPFMMQIVLDCVIFIYFVFMVWPGTNFEVLYTRRNLLVSAIFLFLSMSLTIFGILSARLALQSRTDPEISRYYNFFKQDVLWMHIINFMNSFIILVRFLWNGLVLKEIDKDSQELLNEQLAIDQIKANEEMLAILTE